MDSTSVSLPNIEYGRSQRHEDGDLNVSRMSAGFADVSQLADEEKEKLDLLIERLEDERRKMMATTELLASSQSGRNQIEQPIETNNLQHELEDIKHYNYELERELTDLRASLHPGVPPRSSTPHTHQPILHRPMHQANQTINQAHPPINSTHQSHQPINQAHQPMHQAHQPVYQTKQPIHQAHQPINQAHQPIHEAHQPVHQTNQPMHQAHQPVHQTNQPIHQAHFIPQHSSSPQHVVPQHQYTSPSPNNAHCSPHDTKYYTTEPTHSKQVFGAPPDSPYMTPNSDFISPPIKDSYPQFSNSNQALQQRAPQYDPQVYPTNATPHYEPLKGDNVSHIGQHPSPPKFQQKRELTTKSSRSPMKPPREAYNSLGASPTHNDQEPSIEFSKRSYRSLENSPRTPDPNVGGSLKNGPWGSHKVLPDAPHPKILKPRRRSASQSSHSSHPSSPQIGGNRRNLELSQGGRSPKNFNTEAPMTMYGNQKRDTSTESGSFSDISQKSPEKHRQITEKRHSSRERSPKISRSNSQSLQAAYLQHLEANKTTSEVSMPCDSQSSYIDTPGTGDGSSGPKPKQRRNRGIISERRLSVDRKSDHSNQQSEFSDSLSDASSKISEKRPKRTPKSRDHCQSRTSSRKSIENQPPKPQRRGNSRHELHSSTGSLKNLLNDSHSQQVMVNGTGSFNSSHTSKSSHKSRGRATSVDRGRSQKTSQKSDSFSKDGRSKVTRSDTHGSLVPPRKVNSCENLDYQGSVDSLDTLHGGASHPSLGVYGTSNTETISPIPDSPRSFDPRHEYTEEIDPYANMHSSEHYLTESHTDIEQANFGKSQKLNNGNGLRSESNIRSETRSTTDSKSTQKHVKHGNSHSDASSKSKSHSSFSDKSSKNYVNERRTPISKRTAEKKKNKRQNSDGESNHSRTSPEGDMESKSSEQSSSEQQSFETPEEEMKYLVSKLQGIMPSIHDQSTESRSSLDLKSRNPMNEILLAAQQTRQSIRLFAEYAIAVAAGEV